MSRVWRSAALRFQGSFCHCALSDGRVVRCVLVLFLLLVSVTAQAQNIRNYYVSAAEQDGTIYHLLPQTLFGSKELGNLTFDVTYKERQQGVATVNFTYTMAQMIPADSIRFTVDGQRVMGGSTRKLYAEPGRREWIHRYTFSTPVEPFYTFYDAQAVPEVTIYAGGHVYVYSLKQSAWKKYVPIGFRIFEMIRVNETH